MAATIYYQFSGGMGNYVAELITGGTVVLDSQIHLSVGSYSFAVENDGVYDIRITDINDCVIEYTGITVNCNTTTTTTSSTTTTSTSTSTTTLPTVTMLWLISGGSESGIGSDSPSKVTYWNSELDTPLSAGQSFQIEIFYELDNAAIDAPQQSTYYALSSGITSGNIIGSANVDSDVQLNANSVGNKTGSTIYNITDTNYQLRLGLLADIDGDIDTSGFATAQITSINVLNETNVNAIVLVPNPPVVVQSNP